MNSVLISLHNGIGDLILTFPYIKNLLDKSYNITFETVSYNFDLIKYFFNENVNLIPYTNHLDYLEKYKQYDYVVNLNNMYRLNDISNHFKDKHAMQLNRQILMSFLFLNSNIKDIPMSLSLSEPFKFNKNPSNQILFFSNSRSADNRKINDITLDNIKSFYKDRIDVIIDPRYSNLYELCEAINNAKLVVTVDTGTLHLSEILSTHWVGLYTNNSENILSKYYIHNKYIIKSTVPCSPCNYHGGGCAKNNNNEFECINGFDSNQIISIVENLIKCL
jgi:ADP-heptose:LPS heptosyltransferase